MLLKCASFFVCSLYLNKHFIFCYNPLGYGAGRQHDWLKVMFENITKLTSGVKSSHEYNSKDIAANWTSSDRTAFVSIGDKSVSRRLKEDLGSSLFKQYSQFANIEDYDFQGRWNKEIQENLFSDVVEEVPDLKIEVTFYPVVFQYGLLQKVKVSVDLGHTISAKVAKKQPRLDWLDDWNKLYTVMMIGKRGDKYSLENHPDAPEVTRPYHRYWLHWLVINIPGDKIDKGNVTVEYVGPCPRPGTGLHRYVILAFEQSQKIKLRKKSRISKLNFILRRNFDYLEFKKVNNLQRLIGCNFFRSEWEPYVDEKYGKLLNSSLD